jgi:hypothetical protein
MSTPLTRTLLAFALVCPLACTASIDRSSDNFDGTLVVGDTESDSTDLLDFTIEQTETPPAMPGTRRVQGRFDLTLTNRSAVPVTVRRISMQSAGDGPVQVSQARRNFNRVIAPGATEKFALYAFMEPQNTRLGPDAPVVTRTTVTLVSETGEDKDEYFMRRLNGLAALAVGF